MLHQSVMTENVIKNIKKITSSNHNWPIALICLKTPHTGDTALNLLTDADSSTDSKMGGRGTYIYGRTRLDGYLTNKLGIFALLYVHIVNYSTTFEVF